jgi:hypothetical protein
MYIGVVVKSAVFRVDFLRIFGGSGWPKGQDVVWPVSFEKMEGRSSVPFDCVIFSR